MPISSAEDDTAPPRLLAVHPAGPEWPENILRFHLVFDRAMDPGDAAGEVWLETAAGARVEGALVDMPDGLWSPDATVLTLLFHPGRVKQGLAAHRALGRALVAGGDYRLVIGSGLVGEDGRTLGAARQVPLRIGPAETRGLDPARWQWALPRPGSTAPLAIATGRQIDALSLQGGMRLEDGEGCAHPVALRAEGTTIIAAPAAPWPDAIRLAVAPWLEDVCGNRPHEGFERSLRIDASPPRDHRHTAENMIRLRSGN